MKGLLLAMDVDDVLAGLASGEIKRAELERRLDPAALAVLEEPIESGRWYDVRIAKQLLELLKETAGGGNDFLTARGARAAMRLYERGVYQQLEYAGRMEVTREQDPDARSRAFGRDLRLLTTLSGTSFNFTRWTVSEDSERPGCFCIEIADALEFPDTQCWTTQGYMNWLAWKAGLGDPWRFTRPSPDTVLFRMAHRP